MSSEKILENSVLEWSCIYNRNSKLRIINISSMVRSTESKANKRVLKAKTEITEIN